MIVVPPALVERPLVHYVAQPRRTTMAGIDRSIGSALMVVETWLAEHDVAPVGPPIVRYRVIDMEVELQIEVGIPVSGPVEVCEGLVCETLPAGTYGIARYRNMMEGVEGNGALLDWAAAKGIEWDRWDTDEGDAFGCRIEILLGDPYESPDPTTWEAEVAILVKRD